MDEIKRIKPNYFEELVTSKGFTKPLLVKDYYLTLILYLIKDINGIYFKGGTAINKILLNHARLSEDIDFTLTREVEEVRKEIESILKESKLFHSFKKGKNVDGFLRLIIGYKSEIGEGEIFIDLNKRAKLNLNPETHNINHFYTPFIPEFSVKTLAKEELVAEKVVAAINRNKPRDHFDVYMLIHKNLPINLELIKKKCSDSGTEFSIIKIFNNAKKLKNRWDKDMVSLVAEPISFQEVMTFLAKHFKLKEEKEKLKK